MYNVWWLFIGFAVLLCMCITLGIYCYNKYDNYYCNSVRGEKLCIGFGIGSMIFGIIGLVGVIVCLSFAIANPLEARDEYNEFVETKMMVEEVYQNDYEQFENAGLNIKILELNQWLAKAKAAKKQWGNWSKYCYLAIENLDYIVLVKGEKT